MHAIVHVSRSSAYTSRYRFVSELDMFMHPGHMTSIDSGEDGQKMDITLPTLCQSAKLVSRMDRMKDCLHRHKCLWVRVSSASSTPLRLSRRDRVV